MNRNVFLTLISLLTLAMPALPVWAHEFILVPQSWKSYTSGQQLPFSLVSSHVFMKSEELENPANVKADYLGKDIPVTADKAFQTYTGTVTLGKAGAALLHGHRLGEVWSKTPQGTVKGDRTTLQGVVWSRNYEKFCKTLIPVAGKTDGWDVKTGDTLEIVPLNNPLELRVGDELEVQILYNGKPISPEGVTATFDGFTDSPNAYAFFAEPYGDGQARIQISAPGFWMVRVQYIADAQGADFDQHALRAVLAFPVR
ncbi:MAG: DUF4198 domain-containing protein [Desulfopila sp.]